MSIETTIFNHTYNSLPWSRCVIRVGRQTIEKATIAGVGLDRVNTDQGQYNSVTGDVRLLAADEISGKLAIGDVIEIQQDGKTEWVSMRIGGRYTQGGVTKLNMEAVNE